MIETKNVFLGLPKPAFFPIIVSTRALLLLEANLCVSCIYTNSCFLFFFPTPQKITELLTKEQVNKLLDNGVKAVIATSVAIGDRSAMKFSTQFYESLAKKATIEVAFNEASARIKTEFKDAKNIKIVRGGFDLSPSAAKADFPWGLYVKDESALDWKIVNSKRMKEIQAENKLKIDTLNEQINAPSMSPAMKEILKKRLKSLKNNSKQVNQLLDQLENSLSLLNPLTQALEVKQIEFLIEEKEKQLNKITKKITKIEKQINDDKC